MQAPAQIGEGLAPTPEKAFTNALHHLFFFFLFFSSSSSLSRKVLLDRQYRPSVKSTRFGSGFLELFRGP
jgi:hypothetical protein